MTEGVYDINTGNKIEDDIDAALETLINYSSTK